MEVKTDGERGETDALPEGTCHETTTSFSCRQYCSLIIALPLLPLSLPLCLSLSLCHAQLTNAHHFFLSLYPSVCLSICLSVSIHLSECNPWFLLFCVCLVFYCSVRFVFEVIEMSLLTTMLLNH